jgi:hypothetical protein
VCIGCIGVWPPHGVCPAYVNMCLPILGTCEVHYLKSYVWECAWHASVCGQHMEERAWHVSTYSCHMWGTLLGELHFSIIGYFCMHGSLSYSIKEGGMNKQVVICNYSLSANG